MSRSTLAVSALFFAGALFSAVCPAADNLPGPIGAIQFAPSDWPCWRGAQGTGVASPDQMPPLRWSKSENVLWKAVLPGRGHNSPIVVGDRVIVATADEDREVQSALCFDRASGDARWQTVVHQGGLVRKGNK